MAALWVRTVSVLILLASPGAGSPAELQALCGFDLVEALELVCQDRGLHHYNIKRSVEPPRGFPPPKTGGAVTPGPGHEVAQLSKRVTRGILKDCCHQQCNTYDLQKYCF